MIKELLCPNAIVSYFSTLIGIIITMILIPIIVNIYTKRKNRYKKQFAEKILITKISNHLETLVPTKFREETMGTIWEKNYSFVSYIAHIIPFSLKENKDEEMEKYFIRKLKSTKDNSNYKNIYLELNDCIKDLEIFFYTYSDVFNKKMFHNLYFLDYTIYAQEYNFEVRDELDYEIFAETITSAIYTLDGMRLLILKKYSPNKEKFKFVFPDDNNSKKKKNTKIDKENNK